MFLAGGKEVEGVALELFFQERDPSVAQEAEDSGVQKKVGRKLWRKQEEARSRAVDLIGSGHTIS